MKSKLVKLLIFVVAGVLILFFSNDFGLIDVEKTAIITAVAIDLDGENYKVTAQIAVPEATDTKTENQRAQISGVGGTVGAAIKNVGDTSGWYPQLAFCNLIILGESLSDTDVIFILDYFSKTLRVQDSALTVMAEGSAYELLKLSTPLDNVSSFALQKILLKNSGLNRDIAHCDVKTFCVDYYSVSESSFMPLIKVKSQKEENSKSDGSSEGQGQQTQSGVKGEYIFNANSTVLFYKGKKVGYLDEKQTLAFKVLKNDFSSSTFEVQNVSSLFERTHNYLLTVIKCKVKSYLKIEKQIPLFCVDVDMYVKISDENTSGTDLDYIKNLPLPAAVKEKAELDMCENIESLINAEKVTGCDFLGIKKELFRRHYDQYSAFKDSVISSFEYQINVNVHGKS